MTLSATVHDAMASNTNIAVLVSTRIYPMLLPQTPTLPALSYQRVSNTGQQGSTDLRETRYQINCWAATHFSAETLAALVKVCFEEFTDENQAPGIKMALVVNEVDDYDPDTKLFRSIVDVMFLTTGD